MNRFTKGVIIGSVTTAAVAGAIFGYTEIFYEQAVLRRGKPETDETAKEFAKKRPEDMSRPEKVKAKVAPKFKSKDNMRAQYEKFRLVREADADFFRKMEPKAISIYAQDGIRLVADLFTVEDAKGTVVLVHSYRGNPYKDCASIGKFYYKKGYNVLMPYSRACGKSSGSRITYGVFESVDLQDWCEDMNRRFGTDKPLFIHGISMGGAAALMACDGSLPSNVKGIVDDCGFISAYREFKHLTKHEMHLPEFPFIPLINLMTRKRADFGLKEKDTTECMLRNTDIPVLFIHGYDDDFVPTGFTYENYDACNAGKELLIVPGAAHAMSYYLAPGQYMDAVTRLLDGEI